MKATSQSNLLALKLTLIKMKIPVSQSRCFRCLTATHDEVTRLKDSIDAEYFQCRKSNWNVSLDVKEAGIGLKSGLLLRVGDKTVKVSQKY